MKFNFWQILGIVLILIALSFLIYNRTGVRPANPVTPVAPSPTPVGTPGPIDAPAQSSPANPAAMKSTPIPTH